MNPKENITNDLILTAGPCIDIREAEHSADAAINGWNHHHSDYIKKFEKAFLVFDHFQLITDKC